MRPPALRESHREAGLRRFLLVELAGDLGKKALKKDDVILSRRPRCWHRAAAPAASWIVRSERLGRACACRPTSPIPFFTMSGWGRTTVAPPRIVAHPSPRCTPQRMQGLDPCARPPNRTAPAIGNALVPACRIGPGPAPQRNKWSVR